MELWKDMRAREIRINTIACNMIIDAQARCGEIDSVNEILDVMDREKCPRNEGTFSGIIKCYCNKGNLDQAVEAFRDAEKLGQAKDASVYNTLLDGCMRSSRLELAEKLLEEMEARGIAPWNWTLVNVVHLCSRRHDLDKAFSVSKSLSRQYGLTLSTEVKACLITACVDNRDLDRAYQAFAEFRSGGDSKVYGAMLLGYLKSGRLSEAVAVVEEAYGLTSARGLPKGDSIGKDRMEFLMRSLQGAKQMETVGLPLLAALQAAQEPIAAQMLMTSHGTRKRV